MNVSLISVGDKLFCEKQVQKSTEEKQNWTPQPKKNQRNRKQQKQQQTNPQK